MSVLSGTQCPQNMLQCLGSETSLLTSQFCLILVLTDLADPDSHHIYI